MTSKKIPVRKQKTIEVDPEKGGQVREFDIDTLRAISSIPKKLAKNLKLGNKKPVPKDRKLVDLNDSSVEVKESMKSKLQCGTTHKE